MKKIYYSVSKSELEALIKGNEDKEIIEEDSYDMCCKKSEYFTVYIDKKMLYYAPRNSIEGMAMRAGTLSRSNVKSYHSLSDEFTIEETALKVKNV